jgi:hypothetical protein
VKYGNQSDLEKIGKEGNDYSYLKLGQVFSSWGFVLPNALHRNEGDTSR